MWSEPAAAVNAIATQYAYDPFGNFVASGQNIAYPYQFAGMELDATGLYFNGRGYYDPAFGRALDGAGAPAAPGSGGMGAAAGLPSGSGGGLSGFSAYAARTAVQDAISGAAGAIGAGGAEVAIMYGADMTAGPVGWAVAVVTAIVQEVLDFFGIDFFGGGQSVAIPPMYYRFDHYPAGPFIGAYPALFPNQTDSAATEAGTMFASPGAVSSSAPPSTSGNPSGGHVTLAQFSPYSACGPGNNGKPPINDTDRCCEFHDQCYGSSFSGIDVLKHPFGIGELPRQLICDRALCDCVSEHSPSGLRDYLFRGGIQGLFCH